MDKIPPKAFAPEFGGYSKPHGTFCVSKEESASQRNIASSTGLQRGRQFSTPI